MEDPSADVFTARVTNFGDSGIIAVAVVLTWYKSELENFLMSCRVIGRAIETNNFNRG